MSSLRYFPTVCLTGLVLLISGCDAFSGKTVATLCEEHPELCSDLNPDSWCRAEKANIIKERYDHQGEYSEKDKYRLILFFEDYQACIGKAKQIRHIKLREKESGRMKGFLTAQSELKRLAQETRHSNNPYLAYYQWSRHGHEDSLNRFLYQARSGKLDSAELYVLLATYQAKLDTGQAINSLYTALSLYTQDETVDPEIFASLYTLHQQRGSTDQAITWGLIGSEFEVNNVNRAELQSMAQAYGLDIDKLESKADAILDRIESREFSVSG